MRRAFIASISVLLIGAGRIAQADEAKAPAKSAVPSPAAASTAGPQTDEAKTLYALGLVVSRNLTPLGLSEADLKVVMDGLKDGVLGNPPKVELETWGPKIQELAKTRMGAAAMAEKKSGAAFLEKAAGEPGAVKQPTGFVYRELKAGTGASPKTTDRVKVHYTGTLADGTVFDSSVTRGEPAVFALNQVIPCWTQGVALMKVGGKARLVCPSDLAYGDGGSPPKIKGGATLAFEVELLEIEGPPKPTTPPAPAVK